MLFESVYETNDMDEALAYIENMAGAPTLPEITSAVEKFFEREEGKFHEFADGDAVAEMFAGYFLENELFSVFENSVTCDSALYKVACDGDDVFLTARFELSWTVSDTTMPMMVQRVFSSREPQGYGHAHIHVRGACGELDEQMNGYAYEDMKEALDELASAFYVDPITYKLYGDPYYDYAGNGNTRSTVEKNIKAGKNGLTMFRRYEHALPNALSKFDVDFSYSEIFDVVSAIEARGIKDDEQKLEQQLVSGLAEKAMRRGSKGDMAVWLAFICECYRQRKGVTVEAIHRLFRKYGVYHFLEEFYPAFHVESEQFVTRCIDEYIDKRS